MAENPKPLVSISCITYNHAPYIRECLEGFLMQKTNFPFEILIHDDASTDGTADIIREYQAKYPDIIKPILREKNLYSQGVRMMNRFNYERAKGKYIALCEGDDFWTDPHKLQIQFDFMEKNLDYTVCGCDSSILNEINRTYWRRRTSSWNSVEKYENTPICFLLKHPLNTVTFFIRRSAYEIKRELICRDTTGMPCGDFQLLFHLSHAGKIGFINRDMATYRVARGSAMQYGLNEKRKAFFMSMFACHAVIAYNNGLYHYLPEIIEEFMPIIFPQLTWRQKIKNFAFLIYSRVGVASKRYKSYKNSRFSDKNKQSHNITCS